MTLCGIGSGTIPGMSCGNTQWTPLRYLLDDNTANPTAEAVASPTLIVSNYPETLDENDLEVFPITLYKCEVALTTDWQRVRLYLWHLNKTGQTINIGVVVSVDAANVTATFSNVEKQETPPPNTGFAAQGICLANAQLFGTLDGNGTGTCGNAEVVFRTYDPADDELLGLVLEFDVKADANCNLLFRTVAYEGGDYGVWATNPPEPDTEEYPHPRGKWNHSELDVDCGAFDVSPSPTPRLRKILCCNKLGAEENRFPKDMNDQFGSRLRGLFGANLTYKCAITSEEASGMLHV